MNKSTKRSRALSLLLCWLLIDGGIASVPSWAQPPRPAGLQPRSLPGRPLDIGVVVPRQPGGRVLPLPARVALFPENERSRVVGSTNIPYSYETCQAIEGEFLRDKQRLTFAQLGALGDALNRTLPGGGTCSAGDCYLRVIAANQGTTLTLRGDAPIACEDPDAGGLGQCSLGLASVGAPNTFTRPDRYRGNIVLADTIRVEGTLNLGGLSLVLAARRGIELAPGAVIRGASATAKPAPPRVEATHAAACRTECVRWLRNHGPRDAEPNCIEERETDCTRRYTAVPSGTAGSAGDPSGSLALVAPTLTVHPPGGTAAQIVLSGQPGGDGGFVRPLECPKADTGCRSTATSLGASSRSGAGAAGGAAGKLVVVAQRIVGGALTSSVNGGQGGTPGSVLRLIVQGEGSANRDLGTRGATGAQGTNGALQQARLGDAGYDYAYLLGARAAERLLLNARHYARYVHPTAVPDNAALARGALHALLVNYCRPLGLAFDLGSAVVPGVEPTPSGPSTYVTSRVPVARRAVCREAEARLATLDAGLNWFGLPHDYFMYVRPDVMAESRNRLLAETTRVGTGFVQLAEGQQALQDLATTEQAMLAEKRKRVEIAELRYRTLVEAAMTKLGWVERNHQQLADLDEVLAQASSAVNAALAAPECDFWCVFGDFISLVASAASFVGGVVTALSSAFDFIDNLGDIFDKTRILGQLASTGKITLSNGHLTGTFDELKVFGAYAKAALEGAKIGGEQVGGLSGIGDQVKKTLASWRETEAAVAGPRDVAGALHSVVYKSAAAERELRSALGRVYVAIATVDGLSSGDVTNKTEALGKLQLMAATLIDRIDLSRQSQRLMDEHMMALAEVPIAEQEVELAILERDQTQQRVQQLQCRMGELPASACQGVPVAAASQILAVRRDRACEAGRRIGDATLLFDFYYQRARDFVLLSDRPDAIDPIAAPDPSHNFQRALLDPNELLAFGETVTDSVHVDLIDVLTAEEAGLAGGDYCLPGADCGSGTTPATRVYDRDVLAGLLRTGRTTFDPAADCRPGDPSSRCLEFLTKERRRQRVVDARVELVMAPGYRLGCTDAATCPPGQPVDAGLGSKSFKIRLRHDELASFLWDDGRPRSLLFPVSYPRQACEIASAFSGAGADCSAAIDFSGQSEYSSALQYEHDGPFDLSQAFTRPGNPNAGLFGTSVRGNWTVDLSSTLVQLNGESGDACYRFHPANPVFRPLPSSCLPNGAQPAQVEAVCTRFVDSSGRFRPYGDPACCTANGRLHGNLSPAQRQSCSAGGFDGDAACVAPDPCLEVCGPQCQAFKSALRGLKFAIRWYAEQ